MAKIELLPRTIVVRTKASFLPAAVEESAWLFGDGTLDTPSRATFSFPWFREGWRSLDAGASRHECDIPPWLGDARAPLDVVDVGGLYWFNLDSIAVRQAELALAKEKLAEVELELMALESKPKATSDPKVSTDPKATSDPTVSTDPKATSDPRVSTDPKADLAKDGSTTANDDVAKKKGELEHAKKMVVQKRSAFLAAISKELKSSVQLHFTAKGPLVARIPELAVPTFERTAFVARAARIRDAATLTAPFELLGASPGGYTLTASGLDLDGVVALDSKDELKFGTATVVLEVGVIRASQLVNGKVPADLNPTRVAVRVALQHGANTPPVPADAKPDADKDKASTLQLKIEGVKLDLNPAKP